MRTLIIGIDGASFSIIDPLIEEGKLPNIEELIKDGVRGELESTNPPVTIPAWPSFLTGKNPGKTGVFSMQQLHENSYDYTVYHSGMLGNEFWNHLEDKEAVLVNVPGTAPAKDANATIVSGPMVPSKDSDGFVNRERVRKKYREEIDEYIVEMDSIQRPDNEELLDKVSEMAEKRFQLIKSMVKREDWDLFIGHFLATDRLQHQAYGRKDLLEELYRQIDQYIGELKNAVGEKTNILLMSDHGFGQTEKEFHTGSWLKDKDYTELEEGESTMSSSYIKDLLRNIGVYGLLKYLPDSIFRFGAQTLKDTLDNVPEIDWKNTEAFAHDVSGEIYINAEWKRPKGVVSEEEYDRVRERIENDLKGMKDGDKSLEVEVYRAEDIYKGHYIENAPDLVFKIEDHAYQKKQKIDGIVFRDREPDIGWHRSEGIFIAAGPDISGEKVEGAEILDLAPTILHIMDLEVPEDMDGRVMSGVPEVRKKPEFREKMDI